MKKYLISCDWGTTAFRLRLIHTQNHKVISEVVSLQGIASTYEAWKMTGSPPQNKLHFFRERLKEQIAVLAKQSKNQLKGLDVVVSGMASASIGMYELPYATLPFCLDGNQAILYTIAADENFQHKIILISGVRSDDDVMRGEETQLVGLTEIVNLSDGNFIVILPGTHSKHLYIQKNHLVRFHTYMTGEMFNILSNHSILKDSIDIAALGNFSNIEKAAFQKGVLESTSTPMLNSLFRVRTNQLFQKFNKSENGFYLSGLLIGSELTCLINESNCQLVLCSGNNLYEFYKTAIDILDLSERTITVPSEIIDKAVVVGQMKILCINTVDSASAEPI
jgi:2-dehydro-3-deoxygalactonokinase